MSDQQPDTRDRKRLSVTILAPRENDTEEQTFTVSGSTNANDGSTISVTVSGGASGSATASNGGWGSGNFTRPTGDYSAGASFGGASDSISNFHVKGDAGLKITLVTLEADAEKPEIRHVIVSGTHTSTLGPDMSGKLFDRTDAFVKDHDDRTNGTSWTVRFNDVPLGLHYVVQIKRTINDSHVTRSKKFDVG